MTLGKTCATEATRGLEENYIKNLTGRSKFRTPLTTFVSKNNPSNKCWRNCGMVGDHTHIFWDCLKIQIFWKNVKEELEKSLAMDLPMDSVIFIRCVS